jgi:NAD(P)-dependent dehydrogenase (short-subunit alcohol dehydrogenase family)
MDRLRDRVAIVSGAGSGIGRAVALRLAAEGVRVAGLDVSEAGLSETTDAIRATGGEAVGLVCDVTQPEQVQNAVSGTISRFGRLDALFNGAGASGRRHGDGPVDQCSDEGWEWTIQVNLTSVFLVCKHAIPHLLETHGAVVNLASVLGIVGGDEDFATHAYAASKAGIIGLSRAMAAYYAPRGVRVNVVAPGLIATPMSLRAQQDPHIQGRLQQLQPLTGAMGAPEDVAAAVAYLISDDARFVTGVVLPVDGGWTTH